MMLNARVFLNQTMQKWLKLATPYHQSLLRGLLYNVLVVPYLWRAAITGKDSVSVFSAPVSYWNFLREMRSQELYVAQAFW